MGCPKCHNGYKGGQYCRSTHFYPEIRTEIVTAGSDIDEERIRVIAEKHGMLSMRKSGIDRIRNGLTSVAEVVFATLRISEASCDRDL